ncbi:membrane protein [Novosphingobium endophyticum]|uniref:Membrane protein n=1 Tax=Novosphingobium endophyticum TaxID=1955250 RepID=A0A916TP80_9SPHN|nr:HlyD family efflux transporter periplasmic adaptor subunit [Novosphingobium endophyticum]GGB86116.1 membrane protein [Novosphingobium endophyticum]
MKKIAAAIIGLVVVAAFAIWLWQGRTGEEEGELVLHGNVDIRQVALAFDGNGRVVEMAAEEGDAVRRGEVLAKLDTAALSLQAEQAKAEVAANRQHLLRLRRGARHEEIRQARDRLEAAQSEASRAAADLSRMRAIADKTEGKGVSRQELDRAASAARVAAARASEQREALRLAERGPRAEDIASAAAQLEASQARLALFEHQVSQGELRAPADAVVRSRLLEPGDMGSPQKPVYELALTSPKWVRAYVDEADLGLVRPGLAARVTTDSHPDQPVPGKVGYISSVAEFTPKSVESEQLRTSLVYEVRIIVDDKAGRLRLGQPVTVTIDTEPAK